MTCQADLLIVSFSCHLVLSRAWIIVFVRLLDKPRSFLSHEGRTAILVWLLVTSTSKLCLCILVGSRTWIHNWRVFDTYTWEKVWVESFLTKFRENGWLAVLSWFTGPSLRTGPLMFGLLKLKPIEGRTRLYGVVRDEREVVLLGFLINPLCCRLIRW